MHVVLSGHPSRLTKATVHNRGYYDFRSNGPLLAAVWVDKRSIYFLSTMHIAEASGVTVKRRKIDGTQDDISCPPLLTDYQAYMRGVDHGDQLIGYYKCRETIKEMVEEDLLSHLGILYPHGYVLHSFFDSAKIMDYMHFRIELVQLLIGCLGADGVLGVPGVQSIPNKIV